MPTAEWETLKKLNDYFLTALNHPATTDGITNAIKDFEFREGKQWTSAEITALEERGQPDIVENEILPRINRINGQYKQMKTKIAYRGRNMPQDEQVANVLSDLMLYIQQRNNYEFEEAEVFDDGITCGMGVLETGIEYDDLFMPEIFIRSEDRLNIFPDPYSMKFDFSDATYICRSKWVKMEDVKALYPDKANEVLYLNNSSVAELVNIDQLKNHNYVDDRQKKIRLVEIWYKEKEKKIFAMMNGEVIDVTNYSEKKINSLKNKGATVADKVITKIKMGVFSSNILFEHKDSPYEHGKFPFIPYYVFRKKNGEPYSLVRALIDPQTEVNKRRSKALHLLNTNQVIMGEGAVRDKDELKLEVAKPDGIIETRKYDQFQLVKNIDLAVTQMNLLTESKEAIRRISGISDESMGFRSEIRSGVGLQRKQAMTDVIITPIFENLRRTRLLLGDIVHELIKQFYTSEKIFYITDNMQSRQVLLTQDNIQSIKENQFDVIIEEMPDATTLQDEQFRMMIELMQTMGNQMPPNVIMTLIPLIIQTSQLRGKEQIIQQLQQMNQPPPVLPKMTLQLTWDNLTPVEKASFAQMMGMPELAQSEIQQPVEPAYITKEKAGIAKTQIKEQTDMRKQKSSDDTDSKVIEMRMKQEEHDMDMRHKQEEHLADMDKKVTDAELDQMIKMAQMKQKEQSSKSEKKSDNE